MDLAVRPLHPDEFDQLITIDSRTFGITYSDEDSADVRAVLELERTIGATDGAELVGSAGAWSFDLTVPGGQSVPTAGVTWVGVSPTHRRRGILRSLMARQLDDIAERGEPLAALTASESGIYARFGYGPATQRATLSLQTKLVHLQPGAGDDGLVRFIDLPTARTVLPGIYDRAGALQPGTVSRNDRWWDFLLHDRESHRSGASALFVLVHPDGYVLYRRRNAWDSGFPHGELVVVEMMTASLDAYTSLWRFLLGVDLIETVTFNRYAIGDPLPWLVDEPRQLRVMALWDDVWMRLVDVPAALGARRYLTEDRLVLDVVDTFRPVAGGRFALDGGPDGAECRPTTASADLGLDVGTLGSLYLGGHRPSALARAGRIDELTPGALRRADAFFASDPPPHNQTAF